MIRTFKVGDPFPDLLHHGHHLPLGAKVTLAGRNPGFEQRAPGVWVSSTGDYLHPYFTHKPWILSFLPDGQEQVDLPGETASAFRWRIRDAALSSAERSGINIRSVEELAVSIGAIAPRFELGGPIGSQHDTVVLPTGSLVYLGHPSYPQRFSVLRVQGQRLDLVFGNHDRTGGEPVTLYSVPGDLPSLPEEPEASELELATIALRAWRLGKVAQKRNSWCQAFDSTLEALGINERSISVTGEAAMTVGEAVSRGQAAILPERTLLWWRSRNDSEAFAVYQRDNRRTRNTSRTRRLFGHQDSEQNSHPSMVITWLPGEEMAWTVSGRLLRHFPEGTTYRFGVQPDQTLSQPQPDPYYTYTVTSIPGVA